MESTMGEAHALAAAGAVTGTAVLADEQTGGRGTQGRIWVSPPGGIWASVVLRPPDLQAVAVLSIRLGLGLADLLAAWLPSSAVLSLKWPNDLLLNGRKVGGILCEARWRGEACLWVVAGVGVNVHNPLPEALRDQATRLADAGAACEVAVAGEAVVEVIRRVGQVGGLLGPAELAAWAQRDALGGREITAPLRGRVRGITAEGALAVTDAHGVVRTTVAGLDRATL